MRWSEMGNKEIIDMVNGERLGLIGHTDLVVHPATGQIVQIHIPSKSFWGFGTRRPEIKLNWREVRKIGPDMMIVARAPERRPTQEVTDS
jgi:YlmC/YmxH family sporulation protein